MKKGLIIGIIIGGIIFGSIGVYAAYKYQASEVSYNNTTVEAAINLVGKMKPKKIYTCFIVELDNLKGKEHIDCPVYSTLHYNE